MLKIENISFRYPRKKAEVLRGINLDVKSGGIYGLLGKNGVGKSTLLYLICGLLTPSAGKVLFDGEDTRRRQPLTLSEIFLVPEELDLPDVPLSSYVKAMSPFYPRFSYEAMRRYLELFGVSDDMRLGSVSMGQKKKAYMSFALAANTRLLLMDEPTNGLDIPGKVQFRSVLASSMTDYRSIVISTHQVQDINLLLDHVVVMENTGVLLNASTDEILSRLKFGVTVDPHVAAAALYAIPSLAGSCVVEPNTDHMETQLNLETLFGLVTTRPELTEQIFS